MVDISAIAGTVSALKGAVDITQAMLGLRDAKAVEAKVIELNRKILDAQSSAFAANDERAALIDRVRQLEKEVADLKTWEAEKQKYKFVEVANGIMAYAPKDNVEGAKPTHYLCANCYDEGKKSVLQPEMRAPGRSNVLVCHRCGSDLYVQGIRFSKHEPQHRR